MELRKKHLRKETVSVLLFLSIAFLLFVSALLFFLGYNIFDQRKSYVFRFRSLSGIKKGTEIIYKGYRIGSIEKVEPIIGTDIYFKAVGKIHPQFILYRGVYAQIISRNVIGDAIIHIVQPQEKVFPLKEGDTVIVRENINLDEMMGKLSSLLSNLNTLVSSFVELTGSGKTGMTKVVAHLTSLMARVNHMLKNTEGDIYQTFKYLAITAKTLAIFAREVRNNPLILLKGK